MSTVKNPKILVCTVNAWNDKVGDNTFPLLLQGYPKSCIASLFIREDCPDFSICRNYFRISEKKVIQSIFKRDIKTGYRVYPSEDVSAEKKINLYYHKANFYYTKLICREIIWKIGKWKTQELDSFIDSYNPDIIIYEMSRYIHLNNIVRYILNKTKAKGIGCFWDDTFTYKQEKSIGYKILRYFQRKNLKKLSKNTNLFFAITPKTKREADEFFHINSKVLTKPIPIDNKYMSTEYRMPIKMLYTGNVGIGRIDVLKQIVKELKKINNLKVKLTLDIYTNTYLTDEDRKEFNTLYSKIHPPIRQEDIFKLQQKADVLLFVESLDDNNKIARLSFSTKITDYYASGKCIFAVGNSDLAPMELFSDTDSAITVTNYNELSQKIKLLLDFKILTEYSKKSFEIGQKNHSYDYIRNIFYSSLSDVLGKEIEIN